MFEVLFFNNGSSACLKDGKQVLELQESWLLLYVKFLEEKGIDPTDGIFSMPGGEEVKVFKTGSDYNWRFLSKS